MPRYEVIYSAAHVFDTREPLDLTSQEDREDVVASMKAVIDMDFLVNTNPEVLFDEIRLLED